MFATKLFRAALAPLAFAAAVSTGGAAYAQAVPYNVFAYAIGGPRSNPCNIYYAIAPAGAARYTPANGYTLVRAATNRATAQQFMLLFSKHHNNRPDGVVKLAPCQIFAGVTPRGGTGGIDKCTNALSQYHGLMQKLHIPQDRGRFGDCYNWGWWPGNEYRGHKTKPGYWVYAGGYWYIFSGKRASS